MTNFQEREASKIVLHPYADLALLRLNESMYPNDDGTIGLVILTVESLINAPPPIRAPPLINAPPLKFISAYDTLVWNKFVQF